MCRNITRELQLEGWRAVIDLLRGLKPNIVGILAALTARHQRGWSGRPPTRINGVRVN